MELLGRNTYAPGTGTRSQVQVLPDLSLSVGWAEGPRTGTADVVDLSPVINTYKFYRPLRKNKELFQTAHLVDDGNAIEWGDGTIDMSAELIEDIAARRWRRIIVDQVEALAAPPRRCPSRRPC